MRGSPDTDDTAQRMTSEQWDVQEAIAADSVPPEPFHDLSFSLTTYARGVEQH